MFTQPNFMFILQYINKAMLKTLQRFYSFLTERKKTFIAFVLVLTLTGIVRNIRPYVYKLLIDALPSGDYSFVLRIILLFVGVRIFGNLLGNLSSYFGDKLFISAARNLRVRIFKKIHELDFAFHVNKSTGQLISIFKRGDRAFRDLFHALHMHIFNILVSLLVALFFFASITPSIAWVMIVLFLTNTIVSWRLVQTNIQRRRSFNKTEDEASGVITDSILNYETVKYFSQEEREQERLEEKFQQWTKDYWSFLNSFRVMDITIGTLSSIGMLIILWITVRKSIAGAISTGDLVMVISFITSFYFEFFELLYTIRRIAEHYTDLERYFSVLDNEILIKNPTNPVQVKDIQGKVTFQEVSFSYPDGDENILENISFDIKPGESVAFVGRSGVGKTTIMKLLLRFYDVNKGRVLIDGINVRQFNKKQLRSFIGVVPQEPLMFDNTIGFNVAYGNPKATDRDVREATKKANLLDFIQGLPKKFKTRVGERGIKLSAGQKQRLAIARMILSNPKIIIFDEATSNLDSESEALIQDALWEIARTTTVLIIAHRFSTVRKANKIIVLEDKGVAQIGSHRKLIEQKGLYAHLWSLQARDHTRKDLEDLLD